MAWWSLEERCPAKDRAASVQKGVHKCVNEATYFKSDVSVTHIGLLLLLLCVCVLLLLLLLFVCLFVCLFVYLFVF